MIIAMPLVAAVRARRSPLVAPALAGFVALVVHAGIDWDWEVPAVMIAGLTCAGVLLLASAASGAWTLGARIAGASVRVVGALALFSFVTLTGNRYLGQAPAALDRAETAAAARDAAPAERWAPWSADALERQAEQRSRMGRSTEPAGSIARAIAKDGGDWELWLGLALASEGDAKTAGARPRRLAQPARDSDSAAPRTARCKESRPGAVDPTRRRILRGP